MNIRFGDGFPGSTGENLLGRRSGKRSRSDVEDLFVNERQIVKVDFLDALVDLEERVVEGVRMGVSEYP